MLVQLQFHMYVKKNFRALSIPYPIDYLFNLFKEVFMKSLQKTKSSIKGNLLTSGERKYIEPTTKVKHSKS